MENEMGEACGTHGRGENEDHLEGLGVDGTQTGWEDIYWIDLGQDKDTWRAVVSTVMNFSVA
jgi:hypothetical protein